MIPAHPQHCDITKHFNPERKHKTMTKSLKQLRETAEDKLLLGISNKAALVEAVPLLVELQEAIESANKTAKRCKEVAAQLSEACSGYALGHQSVFDEGLSLVGKGVKSGDLTIDETTYHFTSGYGSPKRIDGDVLNQEFLNGLPEGWTKCELKLDTTGINRLKVDSAALEEAGLYRPEKNEWK